MKDNIEIKRVTLPLSKLEMNNGQLEGLPKNPRQWTINDIDRLAASLQETPELFEMRCPIAAPFKENYVVLGGNLRLAAARKLKESEVPCFVIEGASVDKLREIVIKDNGSFGEWDFDTLGNEWDDLPLTDWGVPAWNIDDNDEQEADTPRENSYSIRYDLVFNNEDEQDRWYAFLSWLRAQYPEVETIAERILLETDKLVRGNG